VDALGGTELSTTLGRAVAFALIPAVTSVASMRYAGRATDSTSSI
jgi:hypothetical protein